MAELFLALSWVAELNPWVAELNLDETGRVLRDDKRGAINHKTVNILARLHISEESWLKLTTDFEGIFTGAVGTAEHLCEFSEHIGLQRTHGITNAQACLNTA